ncbi:helix-turn-helix domain-containing protein [Methylocapsa sp. S129]|uniref:AraC-like ligand-binding domain-containing protein n=1 Tax=Methylocapsa sp. S129 TaxID=1641869 RepID=UPI00131D7291|nr:helix-turn-helix domain-containing protein [Methylocapsa sp. S129]
MQPVFATTANIPVREKFAYWHDVVCDNLVDLEYKLVGDRGFEAAFHGTPVSDLHLCRIQASPHSAERSKAGISRSANATLVFNFVLSGSMVAEQDGGVAQLRAGDGALCDAERPYRLHSDEAFDLACIRVPRQLIASRNDLPQRLLACNFSDRSELAPMVFAYLSRLVDSALKLGDSARIRVAQNFTELLAAMVAELAESGQPPLSEYRSLALIRVKATVERSLRNPNATSATIAEELKLSQRYINQLLEAEGTSLSRYMWSRRLKSCAAQLRNPALRGRSVSQIAMENGFNDLSHFSKAFRNRFGVPPREYRNVPSSGTLA